jgi:lactoylglutathione lyase
MKNLSALVLSLMAVLLPVPALASPNGPTMVFDHLAIHVRDVEKSAAFYEKVFGLERIAEPFHDGLHVWLRLGPGAELHVVGGVEGVAEHAIADHFAFRVASMDTFAARLDGLHIAYRNFKGDGKINLRADGVRQVYFQDPDGYWIEVNDGKP